MTPLATADTAASPRLSPAAPERLSPAAPSLWRVVAPSGLIIGHLQSIADAAGVRYRARRFRSSSRSFVDVGDFWSADDAVTCLRSAT
ncbi:hypothetical protein [Microbacterium sp. 2FI]|uniref:hypothetical protein n=1 Tax=Microbacterium sp. 2FI TaxID=2502193 RepID=UPI0010F822A0|nr:hypothetical protein [Microbacterium sp. 2FI]